MVEVQKIEKDEKVENYNSIEVKDCRGYKIGYTTEEKNLNREFLSKYLNLGDKNGN